MVSWTTLGRLRVGFGPELSGLSDLFVSCILYVRLGPSTNRCIVFLLLSLTLSLADVIVAKFLVVNDMLVLRQYLLWGELTIDLLYIQDGNRTMKCDY